jgi:predicted Zn-dependent protease
VRFIVALIFYCTSFCSFAFELVRDAEIEEYLYDVSKPIFYAAGLKKDSVNFYLVKENSINAFVYGGSNIFVHTGLIESSDTPNMLQGVIAHELGHIMGAHLVKMQPQLSKALATYAIATLLGVGILATDSSMSGTNAAIASTMLGQHIAERQFLSFSRTQEAEADRYAMLFLKKSEISSNGMLELFRKLESMQKKFVKEIDQYSVTHPLSTQRFDYFINNPVLGKNSYDEKSLLERHRFIQAKILAYSNNNTLYTNSNEILTNEKYKLYYLAYKSILENNNTQALNFVQKLLKINKKNPFFHEAASMIYLKLNNLPKAKEHFEKALEYSKNNIFLKHEFASFLIKNFNDPQNINNAIFILESLKNTNEANAVLYQNLQIAYPKLNMEDYYLISRIEEIVLFGDIKKQENKLSVNNLITQLEIILKNNNNNVVMERLKRIKQIL